MFLAIYSEDDCWFILLLRRIYSFIHLHQIYFAGREDKTFDLLSHSTKLNESKKSHHEVDITLMDLKEIKKNFMDELDMSLGNTYFLDEFKANKTDGAFM